MTKCYHWTVQQGSVQPAIRMRRPGAGLKASQRPHDGFIRSTPARNVISFWTKARSDSDSTAFSHYLPSTRVSRPCPRRNRQSLGSCARIVRHNPADSKSKEQAAKGADETLLVAKRLV